jgi:hypothetical protein
MVGCSFHLNESVHLNDYVTVKLTVEKRCWQEETADTRKICNAQSGAVLAEFDQMPRG